MVRRNGVAGHLEHLCEGQLSNCVGVHAGRIEYLNALCFGGLGIDMVEADSADTDYLEVCGSIKDGLVHLGGDTLNQHVIIRNQRRKFLLGREHFGIYLHILAKLFRNRTVDRINNETFHG